MTFLAFAINWLSISINLLLVIFVIVCLLMTLVVLMQRPKQEGLGAAFGGGVTDQVFGARTTNVLQRGTVYLGSMFFIISLLLSVLIGQKNKVISTVKSSDTKPAKVENVAPATPPADAAPKSLSEELPADAKAPDATPAPTQVPADASAPVTPPTDPATPPADASVPAAPEAPVTPPAEAPAQPGTSEAPADKPAEH